MNISYKYFVHQYNFMSDKWFIDTTIKATRIFMQDNRPFIGLDRMLR